MLPRARRCSKSLCLILIPYVLPFWQFRLNDSHFDYGSMRGKLSQIVEFVRTVGESLCQHYVHGGGAHHMLFVAVAELQKVNALQQTFAAAKHRG